VTVDVPGMVAGTTCSGERNLRPQPPELRLLTTSAVQGFRLNVGTRHQAMFRHSCGGTIRRSFECAKPPKVRCSWGHPYPW
jgi:hypothetical protein